MNDDDPAHDSPPPVKTANSQIGPERIDGQMFGPDSVVEMDNRFFTNSVFDRCTLVYRGHGFGWDGSNDFRPAKIVFAGDAGRVVAFLTRFGLLTQYSDLETAIEVPEEVAKQFETLHRDAFPKDDVH